MRLARNGCRAHRWPDAEEIRSGWLGLVWGLPAEQVGYYYPDTIPDDDEPVGSARRMRQPDVREVTLPMNLIFEGERLAGAAVFDALPTGSLAVGRIWSGFGEAEVAPTALYGPPTRDGGFAPFGQAALPIGGGHRVVEGRFARNYVAVSPGSPSPFHKAGRRLMSEPALTTCRETQRRARSQDADLIRVSSHFHKRVNCIVLLSSAAGFRINASPIRAVSVRKPAARDL